MLSDFHHRFLVALLCTLPFLAMSCNSPTTPEEIATQFIHESEKAFEERDILGLKKLISTDYRDPLKRTAGDVVSIAAAYIRGSRSIYLYTDLDYAVAEEERVRARVFTAFGARPISDPSILGQIQVDIYWVDIMLAKEHDGWKLHEAQWQQAMVDDFFKDGSADEARDN